MKNKAAIIRLFAANTISGLAQGISMLAIPWYFIDIIQQYDTFNNIYFATTVLSLFWGLYAGTLVDRFNRKYIFLGETLVGGTILVVIGSLGFYFGQVSTFWVGLVFMATFFTWNIHYPALYAFAQEITAPKDYKRITSYLEIQGQFTNAASGGLAALVLSGLNGIDFNWFGQAVHIPIYIEAWSIQKVFLVDGCTYLLSFLLILSIKYTAQAQRYKEILNIGERLKIGLNFLKQYPLLFMFGAVAPFIFVATMVMNFVILPNFCRNFLEGGAYTYAIADGSFALGAIVAGLLIVPIFKHFNSIVGVITCAFIAFVAYGLLAFTRNFVVVIILVMLCGVANSGSRIMRVAYLFQLTPNQVIGRTSAVFQVINVLMRAFFIYILSMAFFKQEIHFSFLVLSALSLACMLVITSKYRSLVNYEVDQQAYLNNLPSIGEQQQQQKN